jgi:hypothetical protein
MNSEASSFCQTVEWGMRALQDAFPWLKDHSSYEVHGERLLMLLTVVPLFNFQSQYVGLSQICSLLLPNSGKWYH